MSASHLDMQALQSLKSQFSQSLKEFANSSSSSFKILYTVPSAAAPKHGSPISTRVLYVLDSSFNPPSKAHASLVKTALRSQQSRTEGKDETPRVLFLLATVNADKKPKPADFEDRIVMMSLAAEELRSSLQSALSSGKDQSDTPAPIIDIGITKLPYFVDKASSIDASGVYEPPNSSTSSDVVEQIHLTGFDTLLRIFTPKYYPDHDPPLSALEPFLKHHRVRATIRVDPNSPSENLKDAQKDFTTTEGQEKYLEDIKTGSLEDDGMKSEWAGQVELAMDESGEAEGVSSTKVRNAVKEGNWDVVRELVGTMVCDWIKEGRLYTDDKESGKL